MDFKLSREIEFEGKKYNSLTLDFEKLTGKDLIDADAEAAALMRRPVSDYDRAYYVCVAARAAGVPADLIVALPAKDFTKAVLATQNFLLAD